MLGYLDAGSGGVLIQLIVGGLAGLGVFFKMNWHRVRSRFSRSTSD